MQSHSWDVERRADGAVLVRVHSADKMGERLPDAVFTFRRGDPQYEHWEGQWRLRYACNPVVSDESFPSFSPSVAASFA